LSEFDERESYTTRDEKGGNRNLRSKGFTEYLSVRELGFEEKAKIGPNNREKKSLSSFGGGKTKG